jgi:hypothetical protein
MSSSVSHPGQVTHDFGDSQEDERLRGLTRRQLADRLTWLSWWSPGTFQAVMDYMEFADDLAPHCLACGGEPQEPFRRPPTAWRCFTCAVHAGNPAR